jgi:hypothetical protein
LNASDTAPPPEVPLVLPGLVIRDAEPIANARGSDRAPRLRRAKQMTWSDRTAACGKRSGVCSRRVLTLSTDGPGHRHSSGAPWPSGWDNQALCGDTLFPRAVLTGGSQQTASIGASIIAAHRALVKDVLELAGNNSPLAGLGINEVAASMAGSACSTMSPAARASQSSNPMPC